jgi:hypothetical protein
MARIDASIVSGGDGAPAAGFEAGADAVTAAAPGTVDLRIDGGSQITGGDGSGGPGGSGVAIPGTIELGLAAVLGGAGTPPGVPFAIAQPAGLAGSLHLDVTPALLYAETDVCVTSGDPVGFSMPTPAATSAIVVNFTVQLPESDFFFAVVPAQAAIIPGSSLSTVIPSVPGFAYEGFMVYAQGVYFDPATGLWSVTNTASLRVDLD